MHSTEDSPIQSNNRGEDRGEEQGRSRLQSSDSVIQTQHDSGSINPKQQRRGAGEEDSPWGLAGGRSRGRRGREHVVGRRASSSLAGRRAFSREEGDRRGGERPTGRSVSSGRGVPRGRTASGGESRARRGGRRPAGADARQAGRPFPPSPSYPSRARANREARARLACPRGNFGALQFFARVRPLRVACGRLRAASAPPSAPERRRGAALNRLGAPPA